MTLWSVGTAGDKNFSGYRWRKSLTEEYITKGRSRRRRRRALRDRKDKICFILWYFFFFFNSKTRTWSVALWWFILMQPDFHFSANKMHWTGTLRSILISHILFFYLLSLLPAARSPSATSGCGLSCKSIHTSCHVPTHTSNRRTKRHLTYKATPDLS